MAKWIAHVKGAAGSQSFEIAVLREDNAHGIASYGWFDDNKLLVTHSGGPCHWPLTPLIWNHQVRLAHKIADEMNALEAWPSPTDDCSIERNP